MKRRSLYLVAALLLALPAHAASERKPAPAGTFEGAPPQFTKFSARELTRGFLALAFGSDLRLGAKPRGIRKFSGIVRVFVASSASVDRTEAMNKVIADYAAAIPQLSVTRAASEDDAEIVVRLIDEAKFEAALVAAFGPDTARAFVRKTDPQCMTSVKSQTTGSIVRSESFVIADKGDRIFLDCAYHEMLHALGLSSHDQSNPWTTLNQHRMVGYLSVYDRMLLTLLYDPELRPGMTRREVRALLPGLIGKGRSSQ